MAETALRDSNAAESFSVFSIMVPLVTIIVGVFMVVLDATAVNVAVPSLVRDLHSNLTTIQWTITGYALAQAAVIPLAGWLSDRFGAKQIFLISVGLFTMGSVLCATAQSDTMLIAFRVLQGIGGGSVLPIAMAYIYRLSPPARVGAVMGMMGIPILLAPALGPVVAGWLVQFTTWRWIFLLNLPIGIVGIVIGLRGLPTVARQQVASLDIPGAILGPLAFAALCFGVSEGAASWTSTQTIGGLAVGALALVLFVIVELRSRAPLLELRVFKSSDFNLAIVAQWVGQFALFGVLFLMPLFLQEIRGYGAFDTGLILLPQAIAAAVVMPIGGQLFDRIGARPLVIVGLGMVAVSSAILTQVNPTTQGPDLILPLAMTGAGMGLMMMPLMTQMMNAAPRNLVSRVTSLANALQQVVNSLSVAGLATILTSRISTHMKAATAAAHHSGTQSAPQSASAAHHAAQMLLASAGSLGFDDTFRIMVVGAAVGVALGLTLRRLRAQEVESTEGEGATAGMVMPI
jgi:EmrB/QacA subfamily drug resistance transporter